MLKIQTLSSGSKGNITYISSGETSILVDVGLCLKSTLKRLADAGIDPKSISAILVTHEHSDHISGIANFIKKYKPALFVHKKARKHFLHKIGEVNAENVFEFNEPFTIGDILIDFFDVPHDSKFCFGYTFQNGDSKVGVLTDCGHFRDEFYDKLFGCYVLVIESNHCPDKLARNMNYPISLKRRITGLYGHLSNAVCADAIAKLFGLGVRQFVLAHLSAENNSPSLAYSQIKLSLAAKNLIIEGDDADLFIDIAPQHEIGTLFEIE
ncbi:MAG: MBL fold metallo-hydrolase [Christensenellaceae bacterium]|jgi:phosphoribosyl 1,2-cyclic phosphodiesterase|nr:MBL fold metallo-hydrolase [Christensenellaceae bacterium]